MYAPHTHTHTNTHTHAHTHTLAMQYYHNSMSAWCLLATIDIKVFSTVSRPSCTNYLPLFFLKTKSHQLSIDQTQSDIHDLTARHMLCHFLRVLVLSVLVLLVPLVRRGVYPPAGAGFDNLRLTLAKHPGCYTLQWIKSCTQTCPCTYNMDDPRSIVILNFIITTIVTNHVELLAQRFQLDQK